MSLVLELATQLDTTYDTSAYTESIRFKSTLEDYQLIEYIVFQHNRSGTSDSINDDQFSAVSDADPLYYVVTGVYYDPLTGNEIESAFSQEVLGTPLTLDTSIRTLPGRTQFQVLTDFVNSIQRVDALVSLIPGINNKGCLD